MRPEHPVRTPRVPRPPAALHRRSRPAPTAPVDHRGTTGRSSRRWPCRERGGALDAGCPGSLSRAKRSSSRRAISCTDSAFVLAAANSMASGSPSNDRQSSSMVAAASGSRTNDLRRSLARCVNSATESAIGNGSKGCRADSYRPWSATAPAAPQARQLPLSAISVVSAPTHGGAENGRAEPRPESGAETGKRSRVRPGSSAGSGCWRAAQVSFTGRRYWDLGANTWWRSDRKTGAEWQSRSGRAGVRASTREPVRRRRSNLAPPTCTPRVSRSGPGSAPAATARSARRATGATARAPGSDLPVTSARTSCRRRPRDRSSGRCCPARAGPGSG